jgi:uncharacterized membrane protein
MGALQNAREELPGIVAVLVLGLGLADLFLNVVPGVPFWVIFIIGFAVVLPLVGILFDDDESATDAEPSADRPDEEDPLERLKRRYAEGEIGDEEFERRLERLLETEDEGAAADHLRRERSTGDTPVREREEA